MTPVIGPCRDCGRPMIPQRVSHVRPELLGEGGYVRSNAHGMCSGCHGRARRAGTLPDPAPGAQRRKPPVVRVVATYVVACEQCGDLLTTGSREVARQAKERHAATHRAGPARVSDAA